MVSDLSVDLTCCWRLWQRAIWG